MSKTRKRIKSALTNKYNCRSCQYASLRLYNVIRHEKRIHTRRMKRRCCGKIYHTKGDWYHHCETYHPVLRANTIVSRKKYQISKNLVQQKALTSRKKKSKSFSESSSDSSYDITFSDSSSTCTAASTHANTDDDTSIDCAMSQCDNISVPSTVLNEPIQVYTDNNENAKDNCLAQVATPKLPLKKRILRRLNTNTQRLCISNRLKLDKFPKASVYDKENQKPDVRNVTDNQRVITEFIGNDIQWYEITQRQLEYLSSVDFNSFKRC